ncbi:SdpI family protein [Marinicellulosiphila megalodicopiae]|uniref:SdpI family protein n=1 Tax=Marinicellulosiphila megalodicopiae TaxID=2724896 RepID=UPI003BAF515D
MNMNEFFLNGFGRLYLKLIGLSFMIFICAGISIDVNHLPIHWNLAGEPDQFANKWIALAVFPFILIILILVMMFVAKLESRKENLKQSKKALSYVVGAIALLLVVLQIISILAGLDVIQSLGHWVVAGLSFVFLIMGNFMGKIQSNHSFGIRTKATLSDENVWRKTHRLAGFLFVFAAVMGLSALFWIDASLLWMIIVGFVLAAIVPAVYSRLIAAS